MMLIILTLCLRLLCLPLFLLPPRRIKHDGGGRVCTHAVAPDQDQDDIRQDAVLKQSEDGETVLQGGVDGLDSMF